MDVLWRWMFVIMYKYCSISADGYTDDLLKIKTF